MKVGILLRKAGGNQTPVGGERTKAGPEPAVAWTTGERL